MLHYSVILRIWKIFNIKNLFSSFQLLLLLSYGGLRVNFLTKTKCLLFLPCCICCRVTATFYEFALTWTSKMFFKKSVKLHSVASQLSVKPVVVISFKFFFVFQLYTQRKIKLECGHHKISIHYYVYKSFHNDIFCLVKYCHPLQWEKFTALSLKF